jgi:hypothetical protein
MLARHPYRPGLPRTEKNEGFLGVDKNFFDHIFHQARSPERLISNTVQKLSFAMLNDGKIF